MMEYKGFELRTFRMFGTTYWYGTKGEKATGNYLSWAALREAIRLDKVRLTPLPSGKEIPSEPNCETC